MTPSDLAALDLVRRFTPKWSKYIPFQPFPKQRLFLCLDHVDEVLFGGAAGGAKSCAILMAALQYVDQPDYAALILRRTLADLALPGALIDVSKQWLGGTDAKWNDNTKTWAFPPHGSTITFGYLEHEDDKYRYKGSEFQLIALDEASEFTPTQITYMPSRLRRKAASKIPLRYRLGTNPGGPSHQYLVDRFPILEPKDNGTVFIPAKLADNPGLDRESYIKRLMNLDPVTRERYLNGDWTVREGGKFFCAEWLNGKYLDVQPVGAVRKVRYWDLAASTSDTACETAGVRVSKLAGGVYVVEDAFSGKWTSGDRDALIESKAQMDGRDCEVWIEQEPGSGGKAQIDHLIRQLAGFSVYADKVSGEGDKARRAGPFASQMQAGNVKIVRGAWNGKYVDQLVSFDPSSPNFKRLPKDLVDASGGAFRVIAQGGFVCEWV